MRMRKPATFTVSFLRLGSGTKEIELEESSTVADLLDELGYTLGASEVVFVDGVRVSDINEAVLEDGDSVTISTKKDAGSR
jgi:sulfur carrier protein ThiS